MPNENPVSSFPLSERLVHWAVFSSYLVAAGAFVSALILTWQGDLWVGPLGQVSSVSVGCVAVIYPIGQYRFKGAAYDEATSAVLALLFANAFLQVYEVLYNLTFGLASLISDPVVVTGAEVRMLLLWTIMILPTYLVARYLRLRRVGMAVLALTAVVWIAWILYGFPQYYLTTYTFHQFIPTDNRYYLALWLNFGTKALMGLFFVSLLEPLSALRAAFGWTHSLGRSANGRSRNLQILCFPGGRTSKSAGKKAHEMQDGAVVPNA